MTKIEKIYLPHINDKKVDELFPEAMEYVLRTKKLSFSSLQRRFKIGLGLACALYDRLRNSDVLINNTNINFFGKPTIFY